MKLRIIFIAAFLFLGFSASQSFAKCNAHSCFKTASDCVNGGDSTTCGNASMTCLNACGETNGCIKKCAGTNDTDNGVCKQAFDGASCTMKSYSDDKSKAKSDLKKCLTKASDDADKCAGLCTP